MSFGESSLPSIPSGVAELLVQSSASAELVDMDEFLQDYMQDLQNQALYDSIAVPKPLDTPPEVSPTVAPAAGTGPPFMDVFMHIAKVLSGRLQPCRN